MYGVRVINFDLSKIRQSVNAPLTLNIVGQFDDTRVEEEMADDNYRVVLTRITAVRDEGLLKTQMYIVRPFIDYCISLFLADSSLYF